LQEDLCKKVGENFTQQQAIFILTNKHISKNKIATKGTKDQAEALLNIGFAKDKESLNLLNHVVNGEPLASLSYLE
jgi:hypothetical protein